jgi:hypothetical protein
MSKKNSVDKPDQTPENLGKTYTRPVIYSALISAAFLYSFLMSLLFLAGILKNQWLTNVMNDYFPERVFTSSGTLFFTIIGLAVHAIAITGLVFLFRLRRLGFYIFGIATVLLITIPYLHGSGNLLSSVIYATVYILLGLYFKKMR